MALLSIIGTALLMSSALAPPVQVTESGPPESEDPPQPSKWVPTTDLEKILIDRYGDFHVAVVGEEIITRFDVFGWLGSRQFEDPTVDQPDLSPQQRQALQTSAALSQIIEYKLKIQGGRSQGYEDELVESQLESVFRGQIERFGGAQNAAARFKGMGITPQEYKELLGEGLMANLWERSVTGDMPGSTGRVYVDAFVRPGKQWARYREYVESRRPEDNAIVGKARTGKITMQRLVLLVSPGGKPAADVKGEVETLRQRITDGVLTFEEAIQNFVPPDLQGDESIVRDFPTKALSEAFQGDFTTQADEVKTFIEEAPAGSISSVLEFNSAGPPQAYILLKVVDRTKATEALPFANLELQTRLREEMTKEASEVRISRGLAELVRTTHLAPERLRKDFLANGRRFRSK